MFALALACDKPAAVPEGTTPVTLVSATTGKATVVYAEVVDTPEARTKGLMHRTELAADRGMLFIFDAEQVQVFWMKNTPLPLDMIFIDAGKRVAGCIAHTTPYSEEHLTLGVPSLYVLEVNAGLCDAHIIGPGARVEFNR